jgi:2-polyprenyl-6-methoxyphenol hydroxylase-like FAD-dependent oxidoreductase
MLAGDAAHPVLPFLGQGAGQMIEDALILARAITEKVDPEEALVACETAGKPHANYRLRTSREHGRYCSSHTDGGGALGEALFHSLDLNAYGAMRVAI